MWQTDKKQKLNISSSYWRFGILKARNHLFKHYLVIIRLKTHNRKENSKKHKWSLAFASGLFVTRLPSEKRWPLNMFILMMWPNNCQNGKKWVKMGKSGQSFAYAIYGLYLIQGEEVQSFGVSKCPDLVHQFLSWSLHGQ